MFIICQLLSVLLPWLTNFLWHEIAYTEWAKNRTKLTDIILSYLNRFSDFQCQKVLKRFLGPTRLYIPNGIFDRAFYPISQASLVWPTHRHTDHATPSVAIGRIWPRLRCRIHYRYRQSHNTCQYRNKPCETYRQFCYVMDRASIHCDTQHDIVLICSMMKQ